MEELIETLLAIEALLRKYGYVDRADFVRDVAERLRASSSAGVDQLQSRVWWGGAGAISDIWLSHGREAPLTREIVADNTRFRRLLIRMYEVAAREGVDLEHARRDVEMFRQWDRNGVL